MKVNLIEDGKRLLLDYMKLDRALTPEERRRLLVQGKRKKARNVGRASALPGPDGETCGSCRNLDFNQPSNKRFYKCGLVNWSHGPATDIRKKDPACERWQKPLGESEKSP